MNHESQSLTCVFLHLNTQLSWSYPGSLSALQTIIPMPSGGDTVSSQYLALAAPLPFIFILPL